MKRYLLVPIVLALLTSCGSTEKSSDGSESPTIVTVTDGDDLVTALYDNPQSREEVTAFFAELTGSATIAQTILEQSHQHDVPAGLAFALAWTESKFDPEATNWNANSVDRGVFQLNNRSFPQLAADQFFDPQTNITHGVDYLKQCLDLGGNEIVALAMYNAGRGRVSANGTPKSTLDYINKVLRYRMTLEHDLEMYFMEHRTVSAPSEGKTRKEITYVFESGKKGL